MPTYDMALAITYSLNAVDFGAGTVTRAIKGPKGMRGRLKEVTVSATETFTDDTTQAFVRLGISGDLDAHGEVPMGTLASGSALAGSGVTGAVLETAIPADTNLLLTCVAPTGGTPAGIGDVHATIEWYK